MVHYEKLNKDNFYNLCELLKESLIYNSYKKRVDEFFTQLNFFKKILFKKNIILVKLDNDYLGYIWYELKSLDTILLNDIYIRDSFIKYLDINNIRCFEDKVIIYQGFEDILTKMILEKNDFSKVKITKLMKKTISSSIPIEVDENLSIRIFRKNIDEKIRCNIQNNIFNDNDRIPLKVKDIKYEETQEYYINDLCMFLIKDNKEIGYCQVVFHKNMYMIVNFGIIYEFRGYGYGRYLLSSVLNELYKKSIFDVYIRVDLNNFKAFNLYKNTGFNYVGNFSTWIKS